MPRPLGALMFLLGAGLLLGAPAIAREEIQARMNRGLGILLVLASGSLLLGAGRRPATLLSGIVVVVENESGTLVLQHTDGTRSHLKADPELLHGLRSGDSMGVVVEGILVRGLGSPSTGWRWDQASEGLALRRRIEIGRAFQAPEAGMGDHEGGEGGP